MDCESCTDRLIDLLEEAVDEADDEGLRGHLATCEACSAALERLRSGRELASFLVLEEAPSVVRASILAAARERAAGRASLKPELVERPLQAAAREADRDEQREGGGLWSSLMRWLGGFAMGPQVAMSMMLVLMVGIGLWYLPELRRHDPADTHAILDHPVGDEVGPSAALEPAEPLALDADPRTGRVRARDEGVDPERRPPRVETRTATEERAEPARRTAAATADEAVVEAPEGQALQIGAHDQEGPEAAAEGFDVDAPAPPLERRATAPTTTTSTPAQQPAPAPPAPAPPALAPSAEPAPSSPGYATAPAPMPPAASAPARAAPQAMEREATEMVRRPETDTRPLLPAALHQLARNQVREAGCPQGVGSYEQLIARHPTYSGASEARIELADCYRRLGQISRARPLLESAARDARVASRAQQELVRLEAAERAMDLRARDRAASQAAPSDAP